MILPVVADIHVHDLQYLSNFSTATHKFALVPSQLVFAGALRDDSATGGTKLSTQTKQKNTGHEFHAAACSLASTNEHADNLLLHCLKLACDIRISRRATKTTHQ
jgi:hypothetical protein